MRSWYTFTEVLVALAIKTHTRLGVQWVLLYPIEGDIDKIKGYGTPQKWHSENTAHVPLTIILSLNQHQHNLSSEVDLLT